MTSVKLSITVRARLQRKYSEEALAKIDAAVKAWIAADASRGIRTVHVAVDDPKAMKALGVAAVAGRATANKVKRAVDALWARLAPDYLVLLGGGDVVPYFVVANPSYDPNGDDDRTVPTDNPYASTQAYTASTRASYLVPDRVVGRIPDVPADGDPAWLVTYLTTAASWASQPKRAYDDAYAICCDAWKNAGRECAEYVGEPASRLLISPPDGDDARTPRSRLAAALHMIKCHGAQVDPNFYGQKGRTYPVALSSQTLGSRVRARTVVGAMCCYGAQAFSPADPAVRPAGAWPLSSTYLRSGAYGFVGSTMIAWVGPDEMACADWIVAGFLKGVLEGASLGRAMLESKQDYVGWITQQGAAPGIEDEKTLMEFVLLGDPSIHPVSTTTAGAQALAAATGTKAGPPATANQERRQRRVVRAQMAAQLRGVLPVRRDARGAARARAGAIFAALKGLLKKGVQVLGLSEAGVRVQKVETTFQAPALAAAAGGAGGPRRMRRAPSERRESYQYYWAGRREVRGHREIRLVTVETDVHGRVLRGRMVISS